MLGTVIWTKFVATYTNILLIINFTLAIDLEICTLKNCVHGFMFVCMCCVIEIIQSYIFIMG